jgi:hypothetical protein
VPNFGVLVFGRLRKELSPSNVKYRNTINLILDKERSMENRIEQFEFEGKKFIYYDLSHFRNNTQFSEFIEYAKAVIQRYAGDSSLFSITNIEGVIFDSETKTIIAEWMDFNRPYVRQGAVIGLDGIKRIMVNSILKISGRNNIKFFRTRDEAEKWLASL